MPDYEPAELAQAETHLIRVLESSDPPRDAALYFITEAAHEYRDTSGDWDISQADSDLVEELLARHSR